MREPLAVRTQISQATWLQNVAISYLVIWSTSPILAYGIGWRVGAVFSVLIFVLMQIFLAESRAGRFNSLIVLLAIFYVIYTSVLSSVIDGSIGVIRNLQIYIMLFFACVYETRRRDILSLTPVIWVALVTIPIWQFVTFHHITVVDPHAARVVIRSGQDSYDLLQEGVGGYGLIYASVLMVPPLLSLAFLHPEGPWLPSWLRSRPLIAKSIILTSVAVSTVVVIVSGYSIAVVALTVSVATFVLLREPTSIRIILLIAITAIIFMFWQEIVVASLEIVKPFAQGTNYQLKIDDIIQSINFGDATGSFADRRDRYMRSAELFLNNPILGTITVRDLGKHSSVLDNFGQWGLFIGSLFVYLIIRPIIAAFSNGAPFGLIVAMAFAVACVFGLDNGFASAGVALYILFPVAAELTRRRIKKRAGKRRQQQPANLSRASV